LSVIVEESEVRRGGVFREPTVWGKRIETGKAGLDSYTQT